MLRVTTAAFDERLVKNDMIIYNDGMKSDTVAVGAKKFDKRNCYSA